MDSVKGKPDKKLYFQYVVVIKQSYALTGALPLQGHTRKKTVSHRAPSMRNRFLAGNTFSCETPYQRRNLRGSGGNAREPQPWRSIFSAMAGALRTGPLSNP